MVAVVAEAVVAEAVGDEIQEDLRYLKAANVRFVMDKNKSDLIKKNSDVILLDNSISSVVDAW